MGHVPGSVPPGSVPQRPYTAHSIAEFIGWYAPSFISDDEQQQRAAHPYTGQTIAEFIGWLEPGRRTSHEFMKRLNLIDS